MLTQKENANLSPADRALVQLIRAAFPLEHDREEIFDARDIDWCAVGATAQANSLEPMLYASVKKLGLHSQMPIWVIENLRRVYLRTNIANWMAFAELSRLIECFKRAQIEFVLLKGGALARLYPDWDLRPMGDLDLLIRQVSFTQATELLLEQGYSRIPADLDGAMAFSFSERTFVRRGKQAAQVDLHWHLLVFQFYCRRVPIEWFWERTIPIQINGRTARMFASEAQFMHLASHFILHHRGEGLRWSYDIALLLAQNREKMVWDQVAQSAHMFGLIQPLTQALAVVADTWDLAFLNVPRAQLARYQPSFRDRVAFKMATTRHGGVQVFWDAVQLHGMASWFTYLWRKTFPSRAYMQKRYRISNPVLFPFYYAKRIRIGISKFVRALVSLGANVTRTFTRR